LPFVLFPGLLTLAGCSQGYSPNIYAADAAQEEAAVQRGTIIGVREILITPDGTIGAATGGAVGGVAGSQVGGAPVVTALGAIGGTLVGGIGGAAAAQAVGKTKGWEYIVDEEPGDKLVSVTQTSKTPLAVGAHVLVIDGSKQARIVPDYTVQVAAAPPAAKPQPATVTKPPASPLGSTTVEIDISPALPPSGTPGPSQTAPITVASDPTATQATPATNPPPATHTATPAAETTATPAPGARTVPTPSAVQAAPASSAPAPENSASAAPP